MYNRPYRVLRSYDIAVGASSVAAGQATLATTRHVLLVSTVACYVAYAPSSPTAAAPGATPTANVIRVPSNFPLVIAVPPSVILAVKQDATTGTLTVTELD